MTERDWRLITHLPAAYGPEPWLWRRDVWTRRHPSPTPLWVRQIIRRRPPWMLCRDRPKFYRHSPTMRRYDAWGEQQRRDMFGQADPLRNEAGLLNPDFLPDG
jgi:hypothetical protein